MPADIELIFRARPGDDQRCGVGRGAGRPPAAVRVMCVCTDIYTAFCHVSYVIASHHQSSVFRTLVQTAEFCQQSRSLFLNDPPRHCHATTSTTDIASCSVDPLHSLGPNVEENTCSVLKLRDLTTSQFDSIGLSSVLWGTSPSFAPSLGIDAMIASYYQP